jgi:hypothetical protein
VFLCLEKAIRYQEKRVILLVKGPEELAVQPQAVEVLRSFSEVEVW